MDGTDHSTVYGHYRGVYQRPATAFTFIGGFIDCIRTLCCCNQCARNLGKTIDFSRLQPRHGSVFQASHPAFDMNAILIIAPVALILVAENLGHIKAVGAMTGRNLDPNWVRPLLPMV